MVEPAVVLNQTHVLSRFLHDTDGNLRAALICWSVVIGAIIMFRVPRRVLLACLVVATATVGLASAVIDMKTIDNGPVLSRPPGAQLSYRAILQSRESRAIGRDQRRDPI